jgi:hypothetical protein
MSQLVHLVTDGGPGDRAVADTVHGLALALPDAVIHVTAVARGDSLAAGVCVAELARGEGSADRVVVHDVSPRPGEPTIGDRFCVGRSQTGALVVGANVGFAWSFVIDQLVRLCCMDVPAQVRERPARDRLPAAVAHASAHHPHAVTTVLPRSAIPPPPQPELSTRASR